MIKNQSLDEPVYNRILNYIFSGKVLPGTQLVERQLATELGVSRVPVREALVKLLTQGVLVGGQKGQGVRMREYMPSDARNLFQLREVLEGGIAHAAAINRTEDDLLELQMICDSMDQNIDEYVPVRWAELDYKFHLTLAQASHNERFLNVIASVLAEAQYVFYLQPFLCDRFKSVDYETGLTLKRIAREHRDLLALIRNGDGDSAEQKMRMDMRVSADYATRALIARDFSGSIR